MTTDREPPSNADEAMSRYASGDDTAFAIVYDIVAPRIERYLRRHVRDTALIEDILQHTFLQMHDKRGTFVPGARVLPWAFSIALNFLKDEKRKARRETQAESMDEHAATRAFLIASMPNGEQVMTARETIARINAVLDSCTEHQRAAFELTKVDGLSQTEAAEVLNTTVTGIKQCLHKVYEKLRIVLGIPPGTPSSPAPTGSAPRTSATL